MPRRFGIIIVCDLNVPVPRKLDCEGITPLKSRKKLGFFLWLLVAKSEVSFSEFFFICLL